MECLPCCLFVWMCLSLSTEHYKSKHEPHTNCFIIIIIIIIIIYEERGSYACTLRVAGPSEIEAARLRATPTLWSLLTLDREALGISRQCNLNLSFAKYEQLEGKYLTLRSGCNTTPFLDDF